MSEEAKTSAIQHQLSEFTKYQLEDLKKRCPEVWAKAERDYILYGKMTVQILWSDKTNNLEMRVLTDE